MNTDIRLSVGFWTHPKTKRLARECGLEGVRSLQVLWIWAAQNRPDGSLHGMDETDIELAADWQGEAGKLFAALAGRFIDSSNNGYVLHDWEEHNPWVAASEARSAAASIAGKASGAARRERKSNGTPTETNESFNSVRNPLNGLATDSNGEATPSPSPSPKSEEKDTRAREGGAELQPHEEPKRVEPKGFAEWYAAYPNRVGKAAALKAWKSKKPPMPAALEAIQAQVAAGHFRGRDGKDYIPNPSTWLNQGRWEDEIRFAARPQMTSPIGIPAGY